MNPYQPGRNEPTEDYPRERSGSDGDARLADALEQYQAECKAGLEPSRDEFLARYPEVAEDLGDCIDGLRLLQSASLAQHTSWTPEAQTPWSRLGDFEILRELGRGGMGIVYEAVQISLDRRVALKVLPMAASSDSRQRFQVEAQAAAHLHHPHIVPIFAVGCDSGADFYAMQYVEGRNLAEVINDLRRQAEHPEDGLRPAEPPETRKSNFSRGSQTNGSSGRSSEKGGSTSRLGTSSETSHKDRVFARLVARLGVQAAEALEHAHNLGVLHRDIKPSNLMIDLYGDLWVTDFGLARFQDDESLTRSGDIVGTLRYMSPEQALGRRVLIDQRLDLYSLGATLYELATLRPVFEGQDRQELLSKIIHDEPVPPRRLNPAIPRDLETIILKALAKEVGGRYMTAREMADDLERFLDDRPVLARRPTRLDRASKWAKRHRMVLSAMTIGVAISTSIGAGLLWRERQQTLNANKELETTLKKLEDRNQRERAVLSSVFKAADKIMMEAMGRIAFADSSKGGEPEGFYARAVEAYTQFATHYESNDEMRMLAAEGYRRVGFVLRLLRDVKRVEDYRNADVEGAFRRSLAICDAEILGGKHAVDASWMKSTVLFELARTILINQDLRASEPLFQESERIRKGLLQGPHQSDELVENLSYYQLEWSKLLLLTWRHDEAEKIALEVARREIKDSTIWLRLGEMLSALSRYPEARKAFEKALERKPGDPEALNNLAWLLSNRPESPVFDPERAKGLAEQATARAPNHTSSWNTLGMACYRLKLWDEARSALEESMRRHPPDAPDWLILAMLDHQRGESTEARRHFEKACRWIQENHIQEGDLLAMREEASRLLKGGDPAMP
ncbi:protein kinase domain-containing protein [Singulisphaera sp. PoT]|uniref:protein kinase domain-containing protein n=1 Tax=Singulisphaera sp. PoT TaxID=3411797 RepID=UPI003BF615BB